MFRKLLLWFFCKIDQPIYSPSLAVIKGIACIHCGKKHGGLYNLRMSSPPPIDIEALSEKLKEKIK